MRNSGLIQVEGMRRDDVFANRGCSQRTYFILYENPPPNELVFIEFDNFDTIECAFDIGLKLFFSYSVYFCYYLWVKLHFFGTIRKFHFTISTTF